MRWTTSLRVYCELTATRFTLQQNFAPRGQLRTLRLLRGARRAHRCVGGRGTENPTPSLALRLALHSAEHLLATAQSPQTPSSHELSSISVTRNRVLVHGYPMSSIKPGEGAG